MTQKITKQVGIFLSLLLVFTQLSFVQPLISNAAALDQAVTIMVLDDQGEAVIGTKAVEVKDGDTAWDVLEDVADKLDFEETDWGKMLEGINGVAPDYSENGHFWGFFVNGKSASVGLDAYDVKHGDNILLVDTGSMDEDVKVTFSAVDEDESEVVAETEVALARYATAHDAIMQAVDDVDVSVDDQFFSMIQNINGFDMAANQFWELLSNGEALQVGALSHQLEPGEHIQLRLQGFDDGSGDDEADDDEDEKEAGEEEDGNNGSSGNEEEKEGSGDASEEDKELEEAEEKTSGLSDEARKQIDEDIDFLTNKVLDEDLAAEYGSEWWVWGLGAAGVKAPDSYLVSVEALLQETDGDLPVMELEKIIIALSSQGFDATDVAGYDLLELLTNHEGLENPVINAAIYALIAMNSADYAIDAEKEEALIQFILDKEVADGGWAFFGDTPSVDITGMALTALASYQDRDDVKEKINRAVRYLSEEQDETGGFNEAYNGGYSSESAAQAIIGLSFIGVDPTSEAFTKEEVNLIDYLLGFRADDGYLHVKKENEEASPFADQQALLALAYFKDLMLGEGDGGQEEPVEKPQDPNTDPKEDPADDNEDDGDEKKSEDDEEETMSHVEAGDDIDTDENGAPLPKTATVIFNYIAIGLLIIAIGLVLFFIQKRRGEQS